MTGESISGYALKRLILKRMRDAKISRAILSMASRIHFPLLPYTKILGESTKVAKNTKHGMLTSIVYLAPEKESVVYGGKNLCPWATTCAIACLGDKGRLQIPSGRNAKAWRTLTFVWAREIFKAILFKAIRLQLGRARALRFQCGVRLNGASDVVWEAILPEIFSSFPTVQFYDYTKSFERMFRSRPANYDLTFSFDGLNIVECKRVLRSDMNVAIVFKDLVKALRVGTYKGFPVLNGDEHDCRPSDLRGYWVGLSPKGWAKDETGFFVE